MQSHAQDELLKIYRREYKRRFAWIRAGKISQETFSAWSKEAQKERKMQERQDLAERIHTVAEAVMGDFIKMIMNFSQELKSHIV